MDMRGHMRRGEEEVPPQNHDAYVEDTVHFYQNGKRVRMKEDPWIKMPQALCTADPHDEVSREAVNREEK